MIQTDEKINCILGLKDSILLKITILPKTIYRVNAISIKLLVALFTKLEQKIFLKICMETEKTANSKNNLEKEEHSWRNQSP